MISLSVTTAHALPSEADAVIRYCGAPQAESVGTSPISGLTERNLIYNEATLHFVPDGAGWAFTTGWRGHFPVTRSGLQSSMPCFRQAMEEVSVQPVAAIDPTILRQVLAAAPVTSNAWGFPHLGLILFLAVALLMFAVWPRRRRSMTHILAKAQRTRKPQMPTAPLPPLARLT